MFGLSVLLLLANLATLVVCHRATADAVRRAAAASAFASECRRAAREAARERDEAHEADRHRTAAEVERLNDRLYRLEGELTRRPDRAELAPLRDEVALLSRRSDAVRAAFRVALGSEPLKRERGGDGSGA